MTWTGVYTKEVWEFESAGETLLADPDRGLFWPRQRTLFVADPHLGKAASFRRLGAIPLTDAATDRTLVRLGEAILRHGADRLVVLGDLWHSRAGREGRSLEGFAAWRRSFDAVAMELIVGNHDRRSGTLPDELGIAERENGARLGPFVLRHEPTADGVEPYELAGHVHPGARLEGEGTSLVLPCFRFGPRAGLLPAFGEFTGCAAIACRADDLVLVCAGGRIVSPGTNSRSGRLR